jgi:glutamate dehydrogenase/leucine dehydrogenase
MADVDDEIRDIKREIIESRALVIKTSNVLSALAADVKSIAKRQANYERRISWNSWVGPSVGGVRLWPGPEKDAGEPPGTRGV